MFFRRKFDSWRDADATVGCHAASHLVSHSHDVARFRFLCPKHVSASAKSFKFPFTSIIPRERRSHSLKRGACCSLDPRSLNPSFLLLFFAFLIGFLINSELNFGVVRSGHWKLPHINRGHSACCGPITIALTMLLRGFFFNCDEGSGKLSQDLWRRMKFWDA